MAELRPGGTRERRHLGLHHAPRALFDVIEVNPHLPAGLLGISGGNCLRDAHMILRALPDQRQALRRPSPDIEPHVVEAVGNSFEDNVPGCGRDPGVKPAVQNPETHGIALNLLVRGDHAVEIVEILRRRLEGGLARDLDLHDAAAFEGVGQVGLRQGQEEIERRQQGARLQIGDERPAAVAGINHPEHGERAQGLPEAGAADVQDIDQLPFGRQSVACPEHAGPHEIQDPGYDRLRHPFFARGLQRPRDREQLCVALLGHVPPWFRCSAASYRQHFRHANSREVPGLREGRPPRSRVQSAVHPIMRGRVGIGATLLGAWSRRGWAMGPSESRKPESKRARS